MVLVANWALCCYTRINKRHIVQVRRLTTTTLFDASRTWTVGPLYWGAILTAVCVLYYTAYTQSSTTEPVSRTMWQMQFILAEQVHWLTPLQILQSLKTLPSSHWTSMLSHEVLLYEKHTINAWGRLTRTSEMHAPQRKHQTSTQATYTCGLYFIHLHLYRATCTALK